jgi:adenine phosphoribosyltransferase
MKNYLLKVKKIMKEESDYLIPNHKEVYSKLITDLIKPFKKIKIDKVLATDMKGLLYGPIIANKLKLPFVTIFKGGKIKDRKKVLESNKIIDYSGKEKYFELLKNSIKPKENILLIDDWFESGNTGKAIIKLIQSVKGRIVGISVIFNQLTKENENFFNKYNYHYLIKLEQKKR